MKCFSNSINNFISQFIAGKGGKNRRKGKNDSEDKRELVFKEFGQEYGQITKMLGSGHLEVQCFDGEKRLAHIRGKMRKKVWMGVGDVILLSLRDYQEGRADVILKYTPDEARSLKSLGEIPDTTAINENEGPEAGDDIAFEFDEEDIDDI